MRTIQFDVDDKNLDTVLTIINNLKSGIIKKLTIKDENTIETVSDEENSYYQDLLNNMSEEDKETSSKETFDL